MIVNAPEGYVFRLVQKRNRPANLTEELFFRAYCLPTIRATQWDDELLIGGAWRVVDGKKIRVGNTRVLINSTDGEIFTVPDAET